MEQTASLTLALAMVFGILARAAARHLRLPGIVLVLATGVFLGPDGIDLVRPDVMGEALHAFVGFAVAVVFFEGGCTCGSSASVRRRSRSGASSRSGP